MQQVLFLILHYTESVSKLSQRTDRKSGSIDQDKPDLRDSLLRSFSKSDRFLKRMFLGVISSVSLFHYFEK